MNDQIPGEPVTWEARIIVALLIGAQNVVKGLIRLRQAGHRARCRECRHAAR